jgi:hypothetical protein
MKSQFFKIMVSSVIIIFIFSGESRGQGEQYNIERTIADQAQQNTIAFDGLAFLTGNLGGQSFLPPGKVADYSGFQYLRDNDPTQLGHNTDFVTIIAFNVLNILTTEQIDRLVARAQVQVDLINEYAYKRFPLMKAFRRLFENDLPSGATGLDREAVMSYSADLYRIDGEISYDRAKLMGGIVRSFTAKQRASLDSLKALNGIGNWDRTLSDPLRDLHLEHDVNVAVMTYASEMFSWYAGSVEGDVYFCPERQGTYFGSFYLKDWPAMGNPNYTIDEQLTARAGEEFLAVLTPAQSDQVKNLVELQRADLYEIVDRREDVSIQLRRFMTEEEIDSTAVMNLSERYGELDGEIVYFYATCFAEIGQALSSGQQANLTALADSLGYIPATGAFLYSQPIDMLEIENTDFLFGGETLTPTEQKLPDTGQTSDFTSTFGEDSDYTINPPAYADNHDGTITDLVTGLIWQKSDGGEMTWDNAKNFSDSLTLGGFSDWRLPTSHELFNLLDQGRNPALNPDYFTISDAEYWWSANTLVGDDSKVWAANAGGGIGAHPKSETVSAGGAKRFHVRCVRGASVVSQFVNNSDGTVTDQCTSLTWCQQETGEMTWEEALAYCESLSFANHSDWRLPNIKELRSISSDQLSHPSVSTTYFPGGLANSYWSSTTEVRHADQGWFVNFETGLVGHEEKTIKHYIRCVRGGTDDQTSVSENSETAPRDFKLYQNYPNPFNPETTIAYQINAPADVLLKIFNLNGQEVKTLVQEFQMPGSYQFKWDATDNWGQKVSSGIYLYQIQAGNNSQTKKMMVLQ